MTLFDPNTVDDSWGEGFEPLPPGIYKVMVSNPKITANNKNTGTLAKCALQVLEGDYANRLIFQNFNIKHENETAQNIGKAQFKKFLAALGITDPVKSEEDYIARTTDKILFVKLIRQTNKKSGDLENVVKEFINKNEGGGQSQPQAAQPNGAAQSTQTQPQQQTIDEDSIPF